MNATENSGTSVSAYSNLRPFKKGVSPNPGGVPKRVIRARKQIMALFPKWLEKVEALVEAGDLEGLKLYAMMFKHCTPAATGTAIDVNISTRLPSIRPELAAKLAALETQ